MTNSAHWGCTLTICALQAMLPAEAEAEPLTAGETEQRQQQRTLHNIGLRLPGGLSYELRLPERKQEKRLNFSQVPPTPNLDRIKHRPNHDRRSVFMLVKDKIESLRAYTGKDFDPLRLNIKARKLKPSLMIENLHNDSKEVDSVFTGVKSFEVEEDEITLKFYYTF